MASEFNQGELLGLMTGNFTIVKDFRKRTQKVLSGIMLNQDSKSAKSREKLSKDTLDALRKLIFLPEKSRDTIYEEFDPVLILNEHLADNLPKLLARILDFEGDDKEFITLIKAES